MWTLKIGTDERTLSEWGITRAVLNRASAGRDVLVIETTEELSAVPQWTRRQTAQLYWSGGRWFLGVVVEPTSASGTGRSGKRYEIEGGSWFLRSLPLLQNWASADGPQPFGSVMLFARPGRGVAAELRSMIDWVQLAGGPILHGAYGPGYQPPPERVNNITCLGLLQRMMKYMVASAAFFDYTGGGSMKFHCPAFYRLPRYTLRGGEAELEVTEMWESSPTGIVVSVRKQTAIPSEERTEGGPYYRTSFYHYATDTQAVPFANFGKATVSFDYEDGMAPPDAVADYLWQVMRRFRWRGSLIHRAASPLAMLRPGVRFNVAGRDPRWASAGALIQQSALDLFTLATKVTFGPPTHLGPEDISGLLRCWQHRTMIDPDELTEQETGESSESNSTHGDNTKRSRKKKLDFPDDDCCCDSSGGGGGH